jgi:hypothetical protein
MRLRRASARISTITPNTLVSHTEMVGFQHLSLRHLFLQQISLPEIPASKIRNICGHPCEKLLTVEVAARVKFVSLGPTFSKAPDCGEKVRRC